MSQLWQLHFYLFPLGQNYYFSSKFNLIPAFIKLKILFILVFCFSYLSSHMQIAAKKKEAYRKSIRHEQIQTYMKNRRKQMLQGKQPLKSQQKDSIYLQTLNYNTLQNLLNMEQETFQRHLEILNDIVTLPEGESFYERFEEALCQVIQFFEYSYNQWFKTIKVKEQIFEQQGENDIVPLVVMNKMLAFIPANKLTRFIGSVYYEVTPTNLIILKKTVILLREMIAFSMKDTSTLVAYLQRTNQKDLNPMNKTVHKNSILMVFLNITYAEEDTILDLVYEENIIQNISQWIQVYGFSQLEKETIAGIYANMIKHLCNLVHNHEDNEVNGTSRDYYLFLNIFRELVEEDNLQITEKMTYASTQLINIAVTHQMEVKEFIMDTTTDLIRKIVQNKQYVQDSQNLFIVFVQNYNYQTYIGWILQFLRIILNKYTFVYYESQQKQKGKNRMNEKQERQNKGIQNISKLIKSCEDILTSGHLANRVEVQLENQQAIVREIVDFWCKEELEPLQEDFFSFMLTALEQGSQLALFCFKDDQILQVLVSIMNESYEYLNEIETMMKLVGVFLSTFQKLTKAFQTMIFSQYQDSFRQIAIRLEDYCIRETITNQNLQALVEINLKRIEELFQVKNQL